MGAFATTVNSSTSRAVPCPPVPCRACDHTQSVEELWSWLSAHGLLLSTSTSTEVPGLKVDWFGRCWCQTLAVLSLPRVVARRLASPLSLVRDDLVGLVWLVARRSIAQHSVAQHSTQVASGRTSQDGRTGLPGLRRTHRVDSPEPSPGGLVVVTHHGESTF